MKGFILILIALFSVHSTVRAQKSLTEVGIPSIERFIGFEGTGFAASPGAGQLDSDAFAVGGFNEGGGGGGSSCDFGQACPGPGQGGNTVFGRGLSTGGVFQRGIWAFDLGNGNVGLGIKPGGDIFTPGDVTVRYQNNTGRMVDRIEVSYQVWVLNNQSGANALVLSYSQDNVSYTAVPSTEFTSPTRVNGAATWQFERRTATITQPDMIPDGGYFYLRFSGSALTRESRQDEVALDELSVTALGSEADCLCLVVADDDAIKKDISTIENAAREHGVKSEFLINADRTTTSGNPPFRWNELFPGDVVLLPSGKVGDEGWFSLPRSMGGEGDDDGDDDDDGEDDDDGDDDDEEDGGEDGNSWYEAFVAGTLSQSELDKVLGVQPMRDLELNRLEGRSCVAVSYEKDIDYSIFTANLKGKRNGLFFFTVLDVVAPGTIPESGGQSSLRDVRVRVDRAREPGSFCTTRDLGGGLLGAAEPAQETTLGLEESDVVPGAFRLEGNYPNPFNPVTTIHFAVPEAAQVRLAVYDVLGREVARLVDGVVQAGRHRATFEAGRLPSGTYVYRLETPQGVLTGTMVLLR